MINIMLERINSTILFIFSAISCLVFKIIKWAFLKQFEIYEMKREKQLDEMEKRINEKIDRVEDKL